MMVFFASACLMAASGCGDDSSGGGGCNFCSKADSLCTADGGVTVTDCQCSSVPSSVNSCASSASTCSDVLACAAP
ncbi:MAG: hypothetical protein GXP55_08615 [Deltaproteobacteria bacterium]|nr:hypothetical protein [Deltaproteobacteria bacterium]